MLKRVTAMILCLCFAIGFLASCSFIEELVPDFLLPDDSDSYHEIHNTVTVSIMDGEHYKVVSANPVRVGRGNDVSFEIEFEEGYEYESNSVNADFSDGKLTLHNLFFPTTVKLVTSKKQHIIEIPDDPIEDEEPEEEPDEETDEVVVVWPAPLPLEPEDETILPDDPEEELPTIPPIDDPGLDPDFETVVLSAEPRDGYHFICWTINIPITEGGEIFSEVDSGSFTIPTASIPIANYVDDSHYAIIYRANGGTTSDGKAYFYQTFSNEVYLMPNTLMHGTFSRKGYSLMRYTENADGSGENIPLGGKTEVNENGFVELWLKWAKNSSSSDFTFATFVNQDGNTAVEITAYKGSADEVVIPKSITVGTDTYMVERICAEAFSGKEMKKLFIPPTVTDIENIAFQNCTKLEELTIHDTVWLVSDESFKNTTSLSKIYLNAARPPVLAGTGDSMFCRKYEKLRTTYNKAKKIVVMSGSSSLYGFYAEDAQKAFNDEYVFVNYGTNAGANSLFYMSATLRFFGEGDILIHAPEVGASAQMGGNAISDKNFRACESTYELFSYVDMTQFTGFFTSLASYNQNIRSTYTDQYYEKAGTFINSYTDMTTNIDNPSYVSTTNANVSYLSLSRIKSEQLNRMNGIYAALKERGAQMYYTFAPYNLSVCTPDTSTKEAQDAFLKKLDETIDYPIISKPSDYLFTQEHFNNSDHHLGITAGKVRTQRLVADLKKQLESEGVWSE